MLTFTFNFGTFRFVAVRLPSVIMARASVTRLHQQQQEDGNQSCQDQDCFTTHLRRQVSNDQMMQFVCFSPRCVFTRIIIYGDGN